MKTMKVIFKIRMLRMNTQSSLQNIIREDYTGQNRCLEVMLIQKTWMMKEPLRSPQFTKVLRRDTVLLLEPLHFINSRLKVLLQSELLEERIKWQIAWLKINNYQGFLQSIFKTTLTMMKVEFLILMNIKTS